MQQPPTWTAVVSAYPDEKRREVYLFVYLNTKKASFVSSLLRCIRTSTKQNLVLSRVSIIYR